MRSVPIFQVDAFSDERFRGNPAAVVMSHDPLDEALMQRIAAENNLAETAFLAPTSVQGCDFRIRWFTPTVEVDLCGHATLASAHALRAHLGWVRERVTFASNSGPLPVQLEDGGGITLDFPASNPVPLDDVPAGLSEALGAAPESVHSDWCWLAVFESADDVLALSPDPAAVAALDTFAVIAAAPGPDGRDAPDFVSRFFAPGAGVPEDPVTGSAHCVSAPFWARRLGRDRLVAEQWSARRGRIELEIRADRVLLSGDAVSVIAGELMLG
ncbi:MAG: PhzF family phenazine biosynthesis protein [Planctomycetota bacterium]